MSFAFKAFFRWSPTLPRTMECEFYFVKSDLISVVLIHFRMLSLSSEFMELTVSTGAVSSSYYYPKISWPSLLLL